jgi:hypothetical protein
VLDRTTSHSHLINSFHYMLMYGFMLDTSLL